LVVVAQGLQALPLKELSVVLRYFQLFLPLAAVVVVLIQLRPVLMVDLEAVLAVAVHWTPAAMETYHQHHHLKVTMEVQASRLILILLVVVVEQTQLQELALLGFLGNQGLVEPEPHQALLDRL